MRHAAHRRRWIVALLVAALLAGLAVAVTHAVVSNPLTLAGEAGVSASSSALGASPHDAVTGTQGRQSKGWRSGPETTGAWLELQWSRPHDVRRVVVVRNSMNQPGITDGFLSFSDGSDLQLKLSTTSARTVVAFGRRSVDRLRFTVTAVNDGARSVSISAFTVDDHADAGAVATQGAVDGEIGTLASISQNGDSGGSDARVLSGPPSRTDPGWNVPRPEGAWVQLDWLRPRELTTIEVSGDAQSSSALTRATLTFSDGASLQLGAVLSDPDHPTQISFMPRSTTSVRLSIDSVSGKGPLVLAGLRVYQRGVTLGTSARVAPRRVVEPVPAACPASTPPQQTSGMVVLCPTNGAAVGDQARLRLFAGGHSTVSATVWPADPRAPVPPATDATPMADGTVTLDVDLDGLPAGPFTIRLDGRGGDEPTEVVHLQLYRGGARDGSVQPPSVTSRGQSLVYDEEFDGPISVSRTGQGAVYSAAKPTSAGVEDFGDAIFPDPALGLGTVEVVDDRFLRIQVQPRPAGFPDPQGARRTHVGGLLASARPGGSGFAAQYGYFEARMLAPAAPGTWPAFWTLPSTNLISPQSVVPEIDAVELYGHEPTGACHSTHEFKDGKDGGVARCGTRFDSTREAVAWHTYGVSIGPTTISYYIDGDLVATAPQVGGGDEPMFFLLDLALGGGWPIDLAATRERADLYVDYVRVYV